MGEAKLAINNLYNRISGKSSEATLVEGEKNQSTIPPLKSTSNNPETTAVDVVIINNTHERSMAEKLHAIQDRLLDLQLVAMKVEQFMAKEKDRK
jgi:hypothetical protein